MYVLVTLGVYAILVILLRRPGICLYLIATVVLGYLASLGLTDLVFPCALSRPGPWGGLDWTVGFFLFVILVAVGEDYNILLMARVIEEERDPRHDRGHAQGGRPYRRHHQLVRIDHGRNVRIDADRQPDVAARTRLRSGVGILLDTFLVRPILVPAFVVLIDRLKARKASANHRAQAEALASPAELCLTGLDATMNPF